MLPDWNMDKEQYDDIVEEAYHDIRNLSPEWTDFNYHDPGVTLIEMFAWLKESQQYYMDQVSRKHKESYLKLLGERVKNRSGAEVYLNLTSDRERTLYPGTAFRAGDLVFETTEKVHIMEAGIQKYFSARDGIMEYAGGEQLQWENGGRIYPFSKNPKPGDVFYIGFDQPLPAGEMISIYVRIFDDYPVLRNPVAGREFFPLVRLKFSCFQGGTFQTIENVIDETNGFLETGRILFETEAPMEKTEVFGENGYFLRVEFVEGEYDIPPLVEEILMNYVKAEQVKTCAAVLDFTREEGTLDASGQYLMFEAEHELALSGEADLYLLCDGLYHHFPSFQRFQIEGEDTVRYAVSSVTPYGEWEAVRFLFRAPEDLGDFLIGEANGFPSQEYPLKRMQVLSEDFRLMAEDILCPGAYREWKQVGDFSSSGKEDCHFMLDMERNSVIFGDGFHGMPPEGKLLLCSCKKTEGSLGNVKAGKIIEPVAQRYGFISVNNDQEAKGGRDQETLKEAFGRVASQLKKPACAVTAADYEERVKKTPGLLIDNCRAVAGGTERNQNPENDMTVTLIVKPFTWKNGKQSRRISDGYRKNILHYMETYRQLGVKLQVAAPNYVDIFVYLEVLVKAQYHGAEEMVKKAVEEFFAERENQFGILLSYSELYGRIDRLGAVWEIRALSMNAKGSHVKKSPEGSLKLFEDSVAVLKEAVYSVMVS